MSTCSPFLTLPAFLRQHPDTGVNCHRVWLHSGVRWLGLGGRRENEKRGTRLHPATFLLLGLQLLLELNPKHDCGPPLLTHTDS